MTDKIRLLSGLIALSLTIACGGRSEHPGRELDSGKFLGCYFIDGNFALTIERDRMLNSSGEIVANIHGFKRLKFKDLMYTSNGIVFDDELKSVAVGRNFGMNYEISSRRGKLEFTTHYPVGEPVTYEKGECGK